MSKLYTADRFVTIGGTTAQYVTGTGSLVTFPAIPSGADYIQNQNASAQSANMWISGSGTFNSSVTALSLTGINSVNTSGGMTIANDLAWTNNTGYGLKGSDGTRFLSFTTSGTVIDNPTRFQVLVAGSERMRITSDGNLGLGVTPSAWDSSFKALQIGVYAGLTDNSGGGGGYALFGNSYEYSVGAYKYLQNYYATLYRTYAGQHQWFNAPSGTAGNAISFTQVMTLNASGNLGIGTTSPSYKLSIQGSAGIEQSEEYFYFNSSYSVGSNARGRIRAVGAGGGSGYGGDLRFSSRASNNVWNEDVMTISNNSNVGIGTTSPGRKLTVQGNDDGTMQLRLMGTASQTSYWEIGRESLSTGQFRFIASRNGTVITPMVIDDVSGNVGIGNDSTSPGNKLQIGSVPTYYNNQFAIGNGTTEFAIFQQNSFTQLYTNGGFIFATNSAEKMRITSAGNVGINTTSPDSPLEVNGRISIRDANELYFGQSTSTIGTWTTRMYADGSTHYFNASQFIFNNNGYGSTEYLRITSTGNVGIGTTNPLAKLQVSSGRSHFFSGDNYSIGLAQTAAQGNYMYLGTATDGTFYISETGGTARVTVQQGGNVGIGTTSPGAKLQVNGDGLFTATGYSSNGAYIAINQESASYKWAAIKFRSQGVESFFIGVDPYLANTQNFAIYDQAAGATRLYINPSGNVGIGTTSPSEKLHVVGDVLISDSSPSLIFTDTTNNADAIIYTLDDGSLAFSADENNEVAGSKLLFYVDGGEKVRITDSGNVGIGTTSPQDKLTVKGPSDYNLNLGTLGGYSGIYTYNDASSAYKPLRIDASSLFLQTYSGGNVGIGTSNPITKLEVDGTVTISGPSAVKWKYSDNYAYFGIGYISGADYGFYNYNYARADLYIKQNSGNVGIGTTSPGAKLDVNGDALISGLTIGQGPVTGQGNTALGKGALGSMVGGKSNIAVGSNANSDNDVTGLTAIGVDLNTDTNLDPLGQNCLAISQFNANAYSDQVPHIYVPSAISVGSSSIEDIITFDVNHYVGAFIEYVITRSDGGDFAAGTVTVAWKDSGSGNLKDTRDVVWSSYMDDLEFLLSGTTVQLRNDSDQGARIRISVRAMIRT